MTKKPRHLKRLADASKQPHIAGLGILGVPGLRDAAARAAQAEMDAMRAALWAHNYGLNLQELRRMTLQDLAHHINRNTAWGAVEIPSYVLVTIAAMQPTEPAPQPMERKGHHVHGVILDEVKRLDPNKWEVANGPDGPMIFETDHIPPDTMHRTTSEHAQEMAQQIIEECVAKHIDTRLGIAEATGLDKETIDQIRGLHLAEPHLPATTAVQRLDDAGLLR